MFDLVYMMVCIEFDHVFIVIIMRWCSKKKNKKERKIEHGNEKRKKEKELKDDKEKVMKVKGSERFVFKQESNCFQEFPCDFIMLIKSFCMKEKQGFSYVVLLVCWTWKYEIEYMRFYVCCMHVCMHMYIGIDMLCSYKWLCI